jgi:predicted GNAT superfamily acetyltransferase
MTSNPQFDFDETLPDYEIRLCETTDEFAQCVDLQRIVWQFAEADLTPVRSFVITHHSGGFTYGAFSTEDERLLGFSYALPAFDRTNRPYVYSHMAAVLPEWQNAGVGLKLKLAQREHALAHHLTPVKWTFDPLQSRNAYFNIVKLGGVIRQYLPNYYGNQSTSALHRGLDTDRLFVEWWVQSRHVSDALQGQQRMDDPYAAVEVPYDIEAMKKRNLDAARAWQMKVRAEFKKCLSEGLYCAGFEPGRHGSNSRYLFYQDEQIELRY